MSLRFIIPILAALRLIACGGGGGAGVDDDTDAGSTGSTAPATTAQGETGDPGAPTSGDDEPEPEPEEPRQAPSARANVKPKAPGVLARDLAAALELPADALCLELSSIDCFDAHNVALGGVDPYAAAVYEPLPEPGVSSPIAVDRIALSACGERAALDFEGDPVLFAEVTEGAADPDDRAAVAERLYPKILRREAEPHEVQALVDLWDGLEAQDAQTWAQLSCFALSSSLENLYF